MAIQPRIDEQGSAASGDCATDPMGCDVRQIELGRGRSGIVYLRHDKNGRAIACKVFGSHGITKVVQWLFLGTPNPYIWNKDAVECAVLRRRLLSELVSVWFGHKLRVANAVGYQWNDRLRAFELNTEFSHGQPPPLNHPLRRTRQTLFRNLIDNVAIPLQKHLIDAGLDGLLWQAGLSNPVALNNFLYEEGDAEGTWVWIDLESGVPALVPINPLTLLRFYLPSSWKHGGPLFDDVDTTRLNEYINSNRSDLSAHLGPDRVEALLEMAKDLAHHQRRWKTPKRHERVIGYRLAKRQITEEEADYYRRRRLSWYGVELLRAYHAILRRCRLAVVQIVRWSATFDIRRIFLTIGRFLVSQRYRARIAQDFITDRIRVWRSRGQLDAPAARTLEERLVQEESGAYLTDFGVHIAIKPAVKTVQFWVLPGLWGVGLIGDATLVVGLFGAGAIARTLYTLGRIVQSFYRQREKPWVALGVGMVPMIGNFAYPAQILYSSTEEEDILARFILYDGSARIGQHLPVWGGRDTLTEHVFNRLPDRLVRLRSGVGTTGFKTSDPMPADNQDVR